MRGSDRRGVVTARQIRRRRVVLELSFQHGFWSARNANAARKNHDWSRSRIHVDCVGALAAGNQRDPLGAAIGRAGTGAATVADSCASGFPSGCAESHAVLNGDYAFAATFKKIGGNRIEFLEFLAKRAEVAELVDAHV